MNIQRILVTTAPTLSVALSAASCVHVSSDPIEVKPIHIVMDVNVKIDHQLDDFFAFENKYQAPDGSGGATTQPTTTTTTAGASQSTQPGNATAEVRQ